MRSRISYANVVATLALFIALGGGAYAAFELPNGSVGTKQLKEDAVTSNKVKDFSLQAKDFRRKELPAGPTGPEGPQGPAGSGGGLSGLEVVFASTGSDSSNSKEAEAFCPAGKKATGGGALVAGAREAAPTQSAPGAAPNPVSWYVAGHEIVETANAWSLTAYAMCADVTSP